MDINQSNSGFSQEDTNSTITIPEFSLFWSFFENLLHLSKLLLEGSKQRMLRPGFEHGIVTFGGQINDHSYDIDVKQIDPDKFMQYLRSVGLNQTTMKTRMAYARKYYHLLVTGDFSEIMEFSNDKKKHIMKSLALLSKYLGCYDEWQGDKNRYQLKWSVSRDLLASFQAITNQDKIFSNMVEWIRNVISNYPRFKNIFMFNVLTGLRPAEAIESFNILQNPK